MASGSAPLLRQCSTPSTSLASSALLSRSSTRSPSTESETDVASAPPSAKCRKKRSPSEMLTGVTELLPSFSLPVGHGARQSYLYSVGVPVEFHRDPASDHVLRSSASSSWRPAAAAASSQSASRRWPRRFHGNRCRYSWPLRLLVSAVMAPLTALSELTSNATRRRGLEPSTEPRVGVGFAAAARLSRRSFARLCCCEVVSNELRFVFSFGFVSEPHPNRFRDQ